MLIYTTAYSQAQSIDTSYGIDGIASLDDLSGGGLFTISRLLDDGSVIIAGTPLPSFMNSQIYLAKVDPDGMIDPTFGADGYAYYDLEAGFTFISDVLIIDDRIIVAGASFQDGWMIGFDMNGQLASDFGVEGYVDTDLSGDNMRMYLVQENDHILVLHKMQNDGSTYVATSRFELDGTIDGTYGTNGTKIYLSLGVVNTISAFEISQAAFLEDLNRTYFAGVQINGENIQFIASIDLDGELDMEFGEAGVYEVSDGFISSIAVNQDHHLLVNTYRPNSDLYAIHAIDQHGGLISTFGNGGIYEGNYLQSLYQTNDIVPLFNGEFLLLGSVDNITDLKSVVTLHDTEGNVDLDFVESIYDQQKVFPLDLMYASDGCIYISGLLIDDTGTPTTPYILKYQSTIVNNIVDVPTSTINLYPNPSHRADWTIVDSNITIATAQLHSLDGKISISLSVKGTQIYADQDLIAGTYILWTTDTQGLSYQAKVSLW